jgi:phytoene synthase
MTAPVGTAEEITRASKSNLALAFVALPRERRHDMNVFYAFCRVVDDLADEPEPSVEERRAALRRWREAVSAPVPDESPLAPAVRELIAKYQLSTDHFSEIIAGCEMDLDGARYETWDDLRIYCYRVASVVGLVSIEIFGYEDPRCRRYAVDLGLALQLTNILRDVAEDYARDQRLYLPLVDMAECGYSAADLAARRYNDAFLRLMKMEANRAREFYESAAAILPACEQRSMVAAEIMRAVYSRILHRMEADQFRVFERRYKLGRLTKLMIIGCTLLRCLWRR